MTHVYYLKRPLQALIMKVIPLLMNIHECIVQLILAIFQPFFMYWPFFVVVDTTGKMAEFITLARKLIEYYYKQVCLHCKD